MRIDFARLKRDLSELGTIGRTPGGGVTRPSWSAADMEARQWLLRRLADAGLESRVDAAGNIFARWQAGNPVVMVGSHIDSVPDGGTLDGALGVLAGLECLRQLKATAPPLRYPVELAVFTDEEGAFGGFFGSYAFTGALGEAAIDGMRNAQGVTIAEAMARHGLDARRAPTAARNPGDVHAYVELHIEQGSVLEARRVPIGIVDAVVGIRRHGVRFTGRADHAGTTPMGDRKDALLGAADFALKGRELVLADGTAASRATVGVLQLRPGVTNIVPGEAYLTYELREVSREMLELLAARSLALVERVAGRWGLTAAVEPMLEIDPVPMAEEVRRAIAASAAEIGAPSMHLPAMAGHDAQVVGRVTAAGMIFVPSKDGRSHSPLEFTADEDLERGATVLLGTLLRLAGA